MTSASAMARRACSWTRASIGSFGSSSRPPVSTSTNRRPFHSVSPYSRSRVVRARSSTIAVREPRTRLKSVLLPTFGRPTMATTGSAPPSRVVEGAGGLGRQRSSGAGRRSRGAREGGRSTGRRRGHGQGGPGKLRGPRLHVGRARHLEDVLGDVAQVLDRRRRAAGHPDDAGRGEDLGVGQVADALRPGSRASRRSRTAGSAPWCSRSSGRRRRPSGRRPWPPPSCPAGGGS